VSSQFGQENLVTMWLELTHWRHLSSPEAAIEIQRSRHSAGQTPKQDTPDTFSNSKSHLLVLT
jgi:hypothetical protein